MAILAGIQRDPFARGEYHRECLSNDGHIATRCAWCGQQPRRLFRYTWVDDGRAADFRGAKLFCNFACYKVYSS